MPNSLEQLTVVTKQIDALAHLTFPITVHEAVPEITTLLHTYFNFNTLPSFIFDLPDLPEPGWEIFSNDTLQHKQDDTVMEDNPNTEKNDD